jgi:hypothetical protein
MTMSSLIQPVFQVGELLTAQRLNDAVEFVRSAMRRSLLAPLSPGVAFGLDLQIPNAAGVVVSTATQTLAALLGGNSLQRLKAIGTSPPATTSAATTATSILSVTVNPGVAVDGLGNLLVLTQATSFAAADILLQVGPISVGDRIRVGIALNATGGTIGSPASPDPCAPSTELNVTEGVTFVFSKIAPANPTPLDPYQETPSISVSPFADPLDPPVITQDYSVPLGSVIYQADTTLLPSLDLRAAVMPNVGGLRNTFGDVSLTLNRDPVRGGPVAGVSVFTQFLPTAPVEFLSTAGGQLVQAAYLAADVGRPPVGRVASLEARGISSGAFDLTLFEAAGRASANPGNEPIAGVGGSTAVSMQYDVATGTTMHFPTVPTSGFPLVISQQASNKTYVDPILTPPPEPKFQQGIQYNLFLPGPSTPIIGLTAGPSYLDPTGTITLVPVATGGLITAQVAVPVASGSPPTTTYLQPGTLLVPQFLPLASGWVLTPFANSGVPVALTALPLPQPLPNSPNIVSTLVWAVAPSPTEDFDTQGPVGVMGAQGAQGPVGQQGIVGLTGISVPAVQGAGTLYFEGVLSSDGDPIQSNQGLASITFNIYASATGGTALWTQVFLGSLFVPPLFVNGYFQLQLGASGSSAPLPSNIVWSSQAAFYLGVTISNGGITGAQGAPTEMTPRQVLYPVVLTSGNIAVETVPVHLFGSAWDLYSPWGLAQQGD